MPSKLPPQPRVRILASRERVMLKWNPRRDPNRHADQRCIWVPFRVMELMGRVPDRVIARIWKKPVATVAKFRWRQGIFRYRVFTHHDRSMLLRLGSNADAARWFGVSPATIRRIKKRFGIEERYFYPPSPPRYP